MNITSYQLEYLLQRVGFATTASPDDRAANVLFEPRGDRLTAVATDGYQLAVCELNGISETEERALFTIPPSVLDFVAKSMKQHACLVVQVHATQDTVIIRLPYLTLYFPNAASVFPAWRTLLGNLNFDASQQYETTVQLLCELIEHSERLVLLPQAAMCYSQKMLQRAFRAWNKKRYLYKTAQFAFSATKHPSVRFVIQDERPGITAQWTYVLAPILVEEAS